MTIKTTWLPKRHQEIAGVTKHQKSLFSMSVSHFHKISSSHLPTCSPPTNSGGHCQTGWRSWWSPSGRGAWGGKAGGGGFSTTCPWVIEIINSAANDSSPWRRKTLSASLGALHRRWGRFPTHFSRHGTLTERESNIMEKATQFRFPPWGNSGGCCANPTATKWPRVTLKHKLSF